MDTKGDRKSEGDRSTKCIRTVVVDDFPFALKGVCQFLEKQKQRGFQVVGTGCNGDEALSQIVALKPDLVLMDAAMPGTDGFTAAQVICQRWPKVRIIIVSAHDTPVWRTASRAHGAHGFVSKSRLQQDLLPEVERVLRNGSAPTA